MAEMRLSNFIEYDLIEGENDPVVTGIAYDSRQVKPGYIFVALTGEHHDGNEYIDTAIANGAVAIVSDNPEKLPKEPKVITLVVGNARHRLAEFASKIYPDQPEIIVAATGTNGKTSTTSFCRQLWNIMGLRAASVGSIGIFENNKKSQDIDSMTTPDPIILHKALHELVHKGFNHLAIEATSHGLDQHRIDFVRIDAAAFTNISQEHLDYHKNFDSYLKAKLTLFNTVMPQNSVAVINADMQEHDVVCEECIKHGHRVISFGFAGKELKIHKINNKFLSQDVDFELYGKKYLATINLIGEFQVYNALCALALLVATGSDQDHAIEALPKLIAAEGRMEKVELPTDKISVYVDYAHKPEALEKALQTIKNHLKSVGKGKLFVVFGCGGNRDQIKRAMMGKIAVDIADHVIVTDDNPRHEDPAEIRKEIMSTAIGASEIANRKEAIEAALLEMGEGDILLVAGKGHEKYQIIGDEKYPFDDVEIVKELYGRK